LHQDKHIAIKCFQDTPDRYGMGPLFKLVLREYCLLKIASILEAGPIMEPIFGYDIVIYDDCIEISMELCKILHNQKDMRMLPL
jgi:hypothetical protein